MRALTIWQPWASLIMIGAKPYEFRTRSYLEYSRHPQPGERIVIHAGARPIKWAEVHDLLAKCAKFDGAHTGLVVAKALPLLERLSRAYRCQRVIPEGVGLGTAVIGVPLLGSLIFKVRAEDSDRGVFNWAWPLTDIEPFDHPEPMRGMQGFWTWPMKEAA